MPFFVFFKKGKKVEEKNIMKSSIFLLSLAIGDRCAKFTPKSDSTLCVCDDDYCDEFLEKEVIDGFVNLYETSRSGKRLGKIRTQKSFKKPFFQKAHNT